MSNSWPTLQEVASKFHFDTLDDAEDGLFPVISFCHVNIHGEIGENWGGLENIFSEVQLSKTIYLLSISLYSGYDEEYKEYFQDNEDILLVNDHNIFAWFEIKYNEFAKNNGGKYNSEDESYWFTNKKNAVKTANFLVSKLKKLGYNPEIRDWSK